MNTNDLLTAAQSRKILLIIAPPRSIRELLLKITARLALSGSVTIIDGGNSFDVYRVTRDLRRQTHNLKSALSRIKVARAFTCYQMLALLEQTPPTPVPKLVLDLLSLFVDDNVSTLESSRLLQECIWHLRRLSQAASVIVSACPPPVEKADRLRLLHQLQDITENVLELEYPETQPPLRFF